jgi:hypothetical protein
MCYALDSNTKLHSDFRRDLNFKSVYFEYPKDDTISECVGLWFYISPAAFLAEVVASGPIFLRKAVTEGEP